MRSVFAFLALVLAASPAQAHFIYLVPDKEHKTVSMVFSDTLNPDEAVAITKIAMTKLHALDAEGKPVEVKMTERKHHFEVVADGKKPIMIGAVCQYGVLTKKGDPFLLMYYAKTAVLEGAGRGTDYPWLLEGSKELALDVVVAAKKESGKLKVLFQGKPLAGAEVALLGGMDAEELATGETDKDGQYDLEKAINPKKAKANLLAIRIKHVEKKEGELDGKKYKEVRHYSTFTIRQWERKKDVELKIEKDAKRKIGSEEVAFVGKDKDADPAATKLLADARAARALWHKFPGFSAQVVINQDGEKIPCKLSVDATGKVALNTKLAELLPKQEETIKKARGEIASLVSHRMPGEAYETPCSFADKVIDHPQGRLIHVLNDELHSSYRIRDRQILEVNRTTGGGGRFTITVLENIWNKEKTYLPAHYVVHAWDKAGNLVNAAGHRNTWLRLGDFDLPERYSTVTASSGGLSVRTLTFSGHKLGE